MQRTAARAVLAPVAVVVAVACSGILLAGRTFASEIYQGQVVPALSYLGQRIGQGQLPEWWDGVGLGVPFAANPDHPAFYPPAWLVAVVPGPLGADLLVVLHLLWLGLGVALLARRLGGDDPYLMVAGGAAVVSGMSAVAVADGSLMALAWSPWVVLAAARVAAAADRAGRVRASCVLALATAAMLVAGPLGYAPITAALAVAAAVAVAPSRAAVVAATAGLVAGALVAAVALVPAAQLDLTAASLSSPAGLRGVTGALAPIAGGLYIGAPIALLAAVGVSRARWPLVIVAVAGIGLGAARARGHLAPSLLVIIALAPAGLTRLASWWHQRPRLARVVVPLVAATLVGHMIPLWWRALPQTDRDAIDGPPFLIAGVAARAPGARMVRPALSVADADPDPAAAHRSAAANRATRFGVGYAVGVDRALSPRVRQAWRASGLRAERFLDLYGVDLVVLPRTVAQAMSLPRLADDPRLEIALLANDVARPRAFVAPRWRWYADDTAVLDELFPAAADDEPAIELSTVRLLGAGVDGGVDGPAPARRCAVERPRPERVELVCPADAAGYAVLTDAWDPGWSATVAGADRPIEVADAAVRAVRLEDGEARVSFVYRAPGLGLGALVSGLALLNLLALAIVFRRR